MTGASLKSLTREELEAEILRLRTALTAADADAQDASDRHTGREDGYRIALASSRAETVQANRQNRVAQAGRQDAARGEARQRAIFNSAVDFAMVVTDPAGIITDWNSGAERIMGWTAEEMRGQDASRFFTPEDRATGRVEHEMHKALLEGRATDERWHLRKEGQRFWASGEMMPLHDDGMHLGFVKILRDRTDRRNAATQQQADAAFMRSVLASSADCIKVLDLDAKLAFMNEGGMAVMEISDFNTVKGCPWPDFWVGDGNRAAVDALDAARAGGVGHFQGAANTYLGTPKWWDVQVTPIPGVDGKPDKLLAVSRDISRQKLIENQLTASEARWRGLFEGMQEGFFLGELIRDADGRAVDYRFLEINPAFVRQSGLPADCVGRTIRSFIPDIDQWLIDQYAFLVENGEPISFEIEVPALDRVFEARANKDQEDRFTCLFLDITIRKRAEAALQSSEARLATVMEAVPVGILLAEAPSGRILMGNQQLSRVLGHDTLYAASSDAYDGFVAFHADGSPVAPHEYPLARICADECDQAQLEAQYQRPDGQRVWIEIIGEAIKNAHGRTAGAVVAVTSIAERKAAEAHQDILNRELSHRLKNTLALVQSIASQTLRNAPSLEAARDALAARLIVLGKAHDILLAGQTDSASVSRVVREALNLHDDTGQRFRVSGSDLLIGPSAALSLGLMLHELATNALKYGALSVAAGWVSVAWTVTGDGAEAVFQLDWQEHGGPPVTAPTRKGFGSRLIQRGLAGGEVSLRYPTEGMQCTLNASLAGLRMDVQSNALT